MYNVTESMTHRASFPFMKIETSNKRTYIYALMLGFLMLVAIIVLLPAVMMELWNFIARRQGFELVGYSVAFASVLLLGLVGGIINVDTSMGE